jgi:hypothetical protein
MSRVRQKKVIRKTGKLWETYSKEQANKDVKSIGNWKTNPEDREGGQGNATRSRDNKAKRKKVMLGTYTVQCR